MQQKAFGYVRVSGKGQIEGDGFQRQEDAIAGYALTHGIQVAETFREQGVSGTKGETERPAFQEMVTAILKNGIRTVIVEGLDRLARELRIQETLVIYLAAKGITLLSARTEEDVTAAVMGDPMRKALVQIQGVFAELEKGLLVKKLRAARERKRAAAGKCEGQKGYSPDVLARIRQLRRRKPGQKRPSLDHVAAALNAEGMQTVSGKEWTAKLVSAAVNRDRVVKP